MPRPLDGVIVVALEQAVAAPLATRHLADLGARVIKIERIEGGDFARSYDETVRGMSSVFVWLNRSKESMTIDLKHPDASRVLTDLILRADVFVQNLAPGATDRLGFGAEALRAANPRLVSCGISGYGTSGPYRSRKAYDLLIQGESGVLSTTGTPEQSAKVGMSIADISAGMYAYSAILAGLLVQQRTGQGDSIEVSLFDSLVEWMGHSMYYTEYGGVEQKRMGVSHPMIAPYGPFVTSDSKTLLIAVQNEREWASFAHQVVCDDGLATDERFNSMSRRVANRSALDEIIARVAAALTADELVGRLEGAGIASAHINGVRDVVHHEQLTSRGRWHEVPSPVGTLRALVPPALPASVTPRFDPVPALGEHTVAILEWLGYQPDDIGEMRRSGLILDFSAPASAHYPLRRACEDNSG